MLCCRKQGHIFSVFSIFFVILKPPFLLRQTAETTSKGMPPRPDAKKNGRSNERPLRLGIEIKP